MRIAIWENDDISGAELEGFTIHHFDKGTAVDNQMVKQKMCRSGRERVRDVFLR
jgi:hypothetical protein